ncbi:MAG: redox-sensing transcriptional repressor Rex, partial [Clostridia bacterium]
MGNHEKISDAVVRRLPGYYRHLRELEHMGITRMSSQELGQRMGLTASQIRQDINCFGGFGQQGYGYNVPELKQRIGEILGLDKLYHMIIVGAGNIGRAVAHYPTFKREGFLVDALFDVDPALIGQQVGDAKIHALLDLPAYLQTQPVDIVVIATPDAQAQQVMDLAVAAGIRAIWNFAPVDLIAPEDVTVNNVHLSDSLIILSFRMHEREVRKDPA